MLARVTTWEGGTAEAIRAAGAELQSRTASGPPEGVMSSGFTVLSDPDGGRILMISLFESEEALNESEPVLQAMNPPDGIGSRGAPEIYEVAVDIRM